MIIKELIDNNFLTAAGIGNVGELCCDNCKDETGGDSTDLSPDNRCGDVRLEEVEIPSQTEEGSSGFSMSGEKLLVEGIEVLINCDSCECEVNANRRKLQGAHSDENDYDLEAGEVKPKVIDGLVEEEEIVEEK
tara:strand:+ start:68 stop:469 length:402 start_codon:yes stop_codon:yes gene_type:complete